MSNSELNHFLESFKEASNYEKFLAIFIFASPIVIVLHPKAGSVVSGLTILSSLLFCWHKVQLDKQEKLFLCSVLLFLTSLALSILESDLAADGWDRWGRYTKLLFFIPLFIVLKRIKTINLQATLMIGSAIACFAGFLIALYDVYFLKLDRAAGLHHAIFFGDAMALFALSAFTQAMSRKSQSAGHIIFYSLAFLAGSYACFLSETRGAWLTVLLILCAWAFYKSSWKGKTATIAIFFVLPVFIVLKFPDLETSKRVYQIKKDIGYLASDSDSCTPVGSRIRTWRNVLEMTKESPILGTGLDDFQKKHKEIIISKHGAINCTSMVLYTAHSNYFHTLAESGLLGLSALLTMLISGIFLTKNRELSSVFVISSFILFGLTTTWLAKSLSLHMFLLFVSITSVNAEKTKLK